MQEAYVRNYGQFKEKYNDIIKLIIECRKSSGQTQEDVAKWISVDRRKIIDFENGNRFDIELICILCDKFSIELKLLHEQF